MSNYMIQRSLNQPNYVSIEGIEICFMSIVNVLTK